MNLISKVFLLLTWIIDLCPEVYCLVSGVGVREADFFLAVFIFHFYLLDFIDLDTINMDVSITLGFKLYLRTQNRSC